VIRDDIELSISDLHYYLRDHELLQETFQLVVTGTDLIEDALLALNQTDPEDLTARHVDCIENLRDFFYYVVWKYPCLMISQDTATGPSADALRRDHRQEYAAFDETVLAEAQSLEQELTGHGLLPEAGMYQPPAHEELRETLSDLSSQYFD
jgi:hypothetical protein